MNTLDPQLLDEHLAKQRQYLLTTTRGRWGFVGFGIVLLVAVRLAGISTISYWFMLAFAAVFAGANAGMQRLVQRARFRPWYVQLNLVVGSLLVSAVLLAMGPNGHVLYVANSDEHNVRAYDVDRNGSVSNERVVISAVDGVPDGIRVDEKGNIYVAARGLAVYDPRGKLIETIGMPETPANCAFGDADFQTLYITARTSLYRLRRDVKGAMQY